MTRRILFGSLSEILEVRRIRPYFLDLFSAKFPLLLDSLSVQLSENQHRDDPTVFSMSFLLPFYLRLSPAEICR